MCCAALCCKSQVLELTNGPEPRIFSAAKHAKNPATLVSGVSLEKQATLGPLQEHLGCQGTMPGEAAVAVALPASETVIRAAPQKSFPFVLKKIMDIPPPNILEEGEDGKI